MAVASRAGNGERAAHAELAAIAARAEVWTFRREFWAAKVELSEAARATVHACAHHVWYSFAEMEMTCAVAFGEFWASTNRIDTRKEKRG